MMVRAHRWLAAVVLCGWMGGAYASGSWVATAPSLPVVTADRPMSSAVLLPPSPELASGQVMGRVGWQFQPPAGSVVNAWLCHPGGCTRLPASRGQTDDLAGLPADTPLHFQFSLQDRRQRAATLQGLQVIVNHQSLQRP